MNKMITTLAAGAVLCGASSPALADDFYQGYVAVNYIQFETYDRFFGGDRVNTGDLMVRIGGELNDYFVSELRLGSTLLPEEQGGLEYRNDYFIGGFLRLQKQFAGVTPYVGVSYTYIKESFAGDSATLQDAGYAAGVDVSLGERLGLNAEFWMMTGDPINDIDRKGPSVGAFYRF